jgi:serine/threonine protein phosphatase PrpC
VVTEITAAVRNEPGDRETNEDRVRVCRSGSRWLAVLADGAGGHARGAEAARLAVESIGAALQGQEVPFTAQALTEAVLGAHDRIARAQPVGARGRDRMHCTVVVLWIDARLGAALWSHLGDSRLYQARHGQTVRLTQDDSVVQRMLDAGLLTPRQAEVHPQKNQLIAALGIEEPVQPHTLPQPVLLHEGDAFLLCSDGWWGSLDGESAIARTLGETATPEAWLDEMQRRIEQRRVPRQDNFSAIALWAGDPLEDTRPIKVSFSPNGWV